MRSFRSLCAPRPGDRILDLGGNDGSYLSRYFSPSEYDLVIADREPDCLERARNAGMQAVLVDSEDGALPFPDDHFDVVFCNSVIEHVTGSTDEPYSDDAGWRQHARRTQRVFAAEIRRIGRKYFVQTPHPAFPIDQHVWLPFTHWLPPTGARRLVSVTDRWWVKQCGVMDWSLLGEGEMRTLFPDARIIVERWWGLPKAILAVR
jgi:hypothetical protein